MRSASAQQFVRADGFEGPRFLTGLGTSPPLNSNVGQLFWLGGITNEGHAMSEGLSYTEQGYKEQLQKSAQHLKCSEFGISILHAMPTECRPIKSAFTLDWAPLQTSEWYRILVNGEFIVVFSRDTWPACSPWVTGVMSLTEYRKGLRKQAVIQLAVAISLHEAESPNNSLQARRP